MRTTLTLEPAVAVRLKSEVRRTGRPLKVVVNEALKRGLGLTGKPVRPPRFEVQTARLRIQARRGSRSTQSVGRRTRRGGSRAKAPVVILPDVNLLVHAYNVESPRHAAARAWWERALNSTSPVGVTWVALLGFIRLTTNRQVLLHPLTPAAACAHVRAWLAQPYVGIVHPGDRHAELLFGLLEAVGTAGI